MDPPAPVTGQATPVTGNGMINSAHPIAMGGASAVQNLGEPREVPTPASGTS